MLVRKLFQLLEYRTILIHSLSILDKIKMLYLQQLALAELALLDEVSHILKEYLGHSFVGNLPNLRFEEISEHADHVDADRR